MNQRDENIKHKSTSIERKPIIHQTKKIEGNPLMNARHKHSTQSKTGMKYPMFGTQARIPSSPKWQCQARANL